MKSFLKFLTEKLFAGDEIQGQYVEIFSNPDSRDWAALYATGRKIGAQEYGGWVTDKEVVVWVRDLAMHGPMKKHAKGAGHAIPLYIQRTGTTLYVSLASFSSQFDDMSGPRLVQHLQKHPYFSKYKIIDRAEMPASMRY